MRAKIVLASFFTLQVVLSLFTGTPPLSAAREPRESEPSLFSGSHLFPPADLTREETVEGLAEWINGALLLNATIGPSRTELPYYGDHMAFFDGFNRTLSLPVHGFDFREPAGTVLTLYYAAETREFIAMDIRFDPPRPLGPSSLEDSLVSISSALGISLANASYREYSTGYVLGDPNSTDGTVTITDSSGIWRETHGGLEVHFANTLRAFEKDATHTIVDLWVFRWLTDLPLVSHTVADVATAASDAANASIRSRPFSAFSVGLAPNYRNLTWSFLANLWYQNPGFCGGTDTVSLFLAVEDLKFQGIESVVSSVPLCKAPFPDLAVAGGMAVIGTAALFAAWYSVKRRRGRAGSSLKRNGGGGN